MSVYLTELEKTSQNETKVSAWRMCTSFPLSVFFITKDIISRQDVYDLSTYYLGVSSDII